MDVTSATAWLSMLCTDGSSSEGAISLVCGWAVTYGFDAEVNGTRSCVQNLKLYDGFGRPSFFKKCVKTPSLQELLVGSERSLGMLAARWKTKALQMGNARGNTQCAI